MKQTPIGSLDSAPELDNPMVNKKGRHCFMKLTFSLYENGITSQFTNNYLRGTDWRIMSQDSKSKDFQSLGCFVSRIRTPGRGRRPVSPQVKGVNKPRLKDSPCHLSGQLLSSCPQTLLGKSPLLLPPTQKRNVDFTGTCTFPKIELRIISGYTQSTVNSFTILCRKYPKSEAKSSGF